MVFTHHAYSFPVLKYLIPLYLISSPVLLQERIHIFLRHRDVLLGIMVSLLILLPLGGILYLSSRSLHPLSGNILLFQLAAVSFPEEVYFRGFLQERLGNTVKGVVITSMLFSLMHAPRLIVHGDIYAVLTFFPSLVMGFLYAKTSNVLAPMIFHFLANSVWLTFLGSGLSF